jgi:hypothetical protein
MRTSDPEMYKLMNEDAESDRQSQDPAEQYRQAPADKRDQIRQQVEKVVNRHFEVRQERRLLELKRLKEQLQSFQEAVDRRTKARKELVERRISDLLDSDGTGHALHPQRPCREYHGHPSLRSAAFDHFLASAVVRANSGRKRRPLP